MLSFKQFISEDLDDYNSGHRAPNRESDAPLHDLTANGIYPDNIYSDKATHLYKSGIGISHDTASINIINKVRNKPESMVDVYRAVPKHAPDTINNGDWITLHKPYAEMHGKSVLKDYKIIHEKHPAKHIYTDGNSIHEFGLDKG